MKKLEVRGLDIEISETQKVKLSDLFEEASRGEVYHISNLEAEVRSGEATVITIPDPNNVFSRICRVYNGISTRNIVSNLISFLEDQNLSQDNKVYQYLKKVSDLPTPQLETVFNALKSVSINVHITTNVIVR